MLTSLEEVHLQFVVITHSEKQWLIFKQMLCHNQFGWDNLLDEEIQQKYINKKVELEHTQKYQTQ